MAIQRVIPRFWSKVDDGDTDECWEWQAGTSDGYGSFAIDNESGWAHRVAFKLAYDEDPGDSWVLHKCDNRLCVNPEHLYLGDHADNVQDALERKTFAVGEKASDSRVTREDVIQMREEHAKTDMTYQDLSEKYGVSKRQIGNIVRGDSWGHIE